MMRRGKKFMGALAATAAFFLAATASAQAGDATPLFVEDDVIDITLSGPIRDLVRAAPRSVEPYPATLSHADETHAIELSARGRSRRDRDNCQFPPLRVKFKEKPSEGSLFEKQGKLKLVTHCRKSSAYQQYYLLEYTAYRLLNALTPQSFRVRLANVRYVDEAKGEELATRIGFFIEDVDDLARRNDMKEVERPVVALGDYDPHAAARTILFHYMIGNLDWSILKGPDGEDCCHNGKIIGESKQAVAGLVSAPYDFDHSGLVDAPYATPPVGVNIRSVRQRKYRGFCDLNAEVTTAAAAMRAARDDLLAVVDATPGLTEKSSQKAARYLQDFFDEIETGAAVEKNLLRDCRGG